MSKKFIKLMNCVSYALTKIESIVLEEVDLLFSKINDT
jgi:hypothetical protein